MPLILQVDAAGRGQRWITHEDYAYYATKGLVAWEMGNGFRTLHGGYQNTGEQSTLDLSTIVAVKGKLSKGADKRYNIPPSLTNRGLFHRDKNLCAYCGKIFSPKQLTRDHIVPTSKGGPNNWNNVVTSCSKCNKDKGNWLLEEIGMELLYLPYTPNKAEHLILMNRHILEDQMEFLLKSVTKDSRLLKDIH